MRPLLLVALGMLAGLVGSTFIGGAAPARRRGLRSMARCAREASSPEAAEPHTPADGRRAALLSSGLAAVALLAGAPGAEAEVRNVPKDAKPPKPSKNPNILMLQKKSWAMEPIFRIRLYLMAMIQRLELTSGFFSARNIVHWGMDGDNFWKFDVLDADTMREVTNKGMVLVDSDVNDDLNGLAVYIYASDKDRDYVQKNLNVKDYIEAPDDLKEYIAKVRATPFPES